MQLLRGIHNSTLPERGCVATIGNFDGVHLGHQTIVERVIQKAKILNVPSLVVVFEPQPQEYFMGDQAPARLMCFRDKFSRLQALGLDYLCVLRFNDAFRALTAQAFVNDVLVGKLHVKHLVIGDDFRFGGNREGDFQYLQQAGQSLGFGVENTPTYSIKQTKGSARVSSTLIRQALSEGRLDDAQAYLGERFNISGRVMYGQQLGRQLGFPTANVALKRRKNPISGVFAVKMAILEGAQQGVYFGVANVGRKPSVGEFDANLEIHIFDFSGDIYGRRVRVEFLHKIREEMRFESVDALAEQIQKDKLAAQEFVAQQRQPI